MQIIDGNQIAKDILENLSLKLKELKTKGIIPHLGVFLIGDNQISATYVEQKRRACEQIGIKFSLKKFDSGIKEEELIQAIKEIPIQEKFTGLIIQLPLPKHINIDKVLNSIDPKIDIDCLNKVNLEKITEHNAFLIPPTPGAILEIFKRYQIDLQDKKVVLIGLGRLVGKPLAKIFLSQGINLKICNRSTQNLSQFTLSADIIIFLNG